MKSIEKSINKATEFVLGSRDKDGMWYNFLTRHHGESADWVTSFAGLNLLKAGVDKIELRKTARSVLERQKKNGGFSYNDKIVPDADSTAFAIRFLKNFGYEKELKNAQEFLKSHQNNDGGFGTYREKAIREYHRIPENMSVEGWCASTPDITASVFLVDNKNKKARDYLIKTQRKGGNWNSYWWTSDVYVTVHSLEALSKLKDKDKILKSQNWLADNKNVPEAAFYIALSMQGLLENPKYKSILEERAYKLIEFQREDGSWNTTPILRFPLPSNKEPWKDNSKWREDAKDQNRIFTTSTCIRALSCYKGNQ